MPIVRGQDAGARLEVRRYRAVGGLAAWRLPVLTALLAAAATGLGAPELALVTVVVGAAVHGLCRNVTIEVSAAGLSHGLVLKGAFAGRATVIGWAAVVDVHTDWRHPGDDTALETTVRGRDGTTIRFSTTMGLGVYCACLADVAARVPATARTGLTEATLADAPPSGRQALSIAATVGTLALIIAALVAFHYVLAQGRSTLSRYLEETGAASSAP